MYKHFDRIMNRKLLKILAGIPCKTRALHFFTGSGKSVLTLIFPIIRQMAGKDLRHRFHIHAGSNSDILADVESFGLDEAHLRAMFDGAPKSVELCGEQLVERRALEKTRVQAFQEMAEEVDVDEEAELQDT